MSRGNHREAVFRSPKDRELFLRTLGQACEKTDWQVHAWCLMSSHFHLVVETPRANLVSGMKWLLGTYTMRFNRRHKLFGHLFNGRYKALPKRGSAAHRRLSPPNSRNSAAPCGGACHLRNSLPSNKPEAP